MTTNKSESLKATKKDIVAAATTRIERKKEDNDPWDKFKNINKLPTPVIIYPNLSLDTEDIQTKIEETHRKCLSYDWARNQFGSDPHEIMIFKKIEPPICEKIIKKHHGVDDKIDRQSDINYAEAKEWVKGGKKGELKYSIPEENKEILRKAIRDVNTEEILKHGLGKSLTQSISKKCAKLEPIQLRLQDYDEVTKWVKEKEAVFDLPKLTESEDPFLKEKKEWGKESDEEFIMTQIALIESVHDQKKVETDEEQRKIREFYESKQSAKQIQVFEEFSLEEPEECIIEEEDEYLSE